MSDYLLMIVMFFLFNPMSSHVFSLKFLQDDYPVDVLTKCTSRDVCFSIYVYTYIYIHTHLHVYMFNVCLHVDHV